MEHSIEQNNGVVRWMPRVVKNLVPIIKIESITKRHKEVSVDLTKSGYIGLTVIDLKGDILVCLTAIERIYLVTKDPTDVSFLKKQLRRDDIHFFTTNGSEDARLLEKHMGINLANQTDLVALDQYISIKDHIMINPTPPKEYSILYFMEKHKILKRDYEKLLIFYLDIELNLSCSEAELESIRSDPYSKMAQNGILKRSVLARELGTKMIQMFYRLRDDASENIYLFAGISDEFREEYDRKSENTYSSLLSFLQRSPNSITITPSLAL